MAELRNESRKTKSVMDLEGQCRRFIEVLVTRGQNPEMPLNVRCCPLPNNCRDEIIKGNKMHG